MAHPTAGPSAGELAVDDRPGAAEPGWRIGELARRTGLTTKAIRYYEEAGLLPPPARTRSGYRSYAPRDEERLAFILAAKDFGFTLGEIREILAVQDRDEAPCPYVLAVTREKLADLQDRIQRLRLLSEDLEAIVREAEQLPAEARQRTGQYCHAIEQQRPRSEDARLDLPV